MNSNEAILTAAAAIRSIEWGLRGIRHGHVELSDMRRVLDRNVLVLDEALANGGDALLRDASWARRYTRAANLYLEMIA